MQRQLQFKRNQLVGLFISLLLYVVPAVSSEENSDPDIAAARAAINDMEYSKAAVNLVRYLNQHPGDIRILHLLAKTYTWDNQFELASITYDKLIKINPDEVEYLFGKATALVWQEKIPQAIPLLEKAWSLQNNNAEILRTLILSLNRSNKPEHKQRAKELGQLAVKQFPNMHWDLMIE